MVEIDLKKLRESLSVHLREIGLIQTQCENVLGFVVKQDKEFLKEIEESSMIDPEKMEEFNKLVEKVLK